MRRAAKRDANERAIISTWEAMGAYVESVNGPGLADTLVHYEGSLFRAEVKGAKNGLTEKQVENFEAAYVAGVSTFIIRTTEDAQALLRDAAARLVWRPGMGALAGADRKERPFRPGTDRARSLGEMCTRHGCPTSKTPGQNVCAAHASEVFAPPECTCDSDEIPFCVAHPGDDSDAHGRANLTRIGARSTRREDDEA